MGEILTSIALMASTVGGIAVAGKQVLSFWRGVSTLLPRVDGSLEKVLKGYFPEPGNEKEKRGWGWR
jgi:hypothetical protein